MILFYVTYRLVFIILLTLVSLFFQLNFESVHYKSDFIVIGIK